MVGPSSQRGVTKPAWVLLIFLAMVTLGACSVPKHGPTTAPNIALFTEVRDQRGTLVASASLRGHWSVLWFYPRAQTSG